MKRIVFIFLFQLSFSSFSQVRTEDKPAVQVLARSFGDSIVLRWGASSPMGWKLSNKYGYMIERYTLLKGEKPDKKARPEKAVLSSVPVKPWPLEKWEGLAKRNEFGAIAAQAIYGSSFTMTNNSNEVIQAVNKAQELEMRFTFALTAADQSLEVANACGLKFTDRTVKKGEKYVYKIYSLVPSGTYAIDTGTVFIGTNDNYPLPKPVQLKAVFEDRKVMLSWNQIYYKDLYHTYILERSEDGGRTYVKRGSLPFVNTSPSAERELNNVWRYDSLPGNNRLYVYRVRGITSFEEVSPPSDTVQGMGKPASLAVSPVITDIENQKDGSLKVKWRFPDEYNNKIKEFEILRSASSGGEYKSIGTENSLARAYTDLKPGRANYYIVRSIEPTGASSSSFPALGQPIDSIPPTAPAGLTGSVDKTGKVMLNWKKGSEPDILGYRVYMANNPEEEFTQITKELVKDTLFTAPLNLNTITSKVYYRIMAFDLNYNISPFSDILTLNRPDTIAPVPPVVTRYQTSDTTVFLEWIVSTSNDVVKHIVYRREKGTEVWKPVYESPDTAKTYLDKALEKRKDYEYVIVAKDDDGLESEKRQIITAGLKDFGIRGEIKEIEAKADRTKKEIELKWTCHEGTPERFIIYKAVKGEPIRVYKSVYGQTGLFKDKLLEMNTAYTYRIQAVYSDGSTSAISQEIVVNY